ncbi:MAG: hypothetical protein JRF33_02920 [Deltaproteobacteria bacterium]|nr:hypothetical protein [Deltaproteobacteria bacterium]
MKLLDFIACDDIRHELGGKLSLMGVFGDSIKLQVPKGAQKPFAFPLALYLRILIEENDSVPDRFKAIIRLDEKEFAKIEGNIGVLGDRPKILGFVLPLNMFKISENATLSLTATFFAGGQSLMDISPPYDISIQVIETEEPMPKRQG